MSPRPENLPRECLRQVKVVLMSRLTLTRTQMATRFSLERALKTSGQTSASFCLLAEVPVLYHACSSPPTQPAATLTLAAPTSFALLQVQVSELVESLV